jgi:hypothetical protein
MSSSVGRPEKDMVVVAEHALMTLQILMMIPPSRAARVGRPHLRARSGCSTTTTMSLSDLPTELLIRILCLRNALFVVKRGMVRRSPAGQHEKYHLWLRPPDLQAGAESRIDPRYSVLNIAERMRYDR